MKISLPDFAILGKNVEKNFDDVRQPREGETNWVESYFEIFGGRKLHSVIKVQCIVFYRVVSISVAVTAGGTICHVTVIPLYPHCCRGCPFHWEIWCVCA